METFFEVVGVGAVAGSALATLYFVIGLCVKHSLGTSPFQRLARRVDELDAEIEETDDIAGHNSDLADGLAERVDALDDWVDEFAKSDVMDSLFDSAFEAIDRLDTQAAVIADISKRLDALENAVTDNGKKAVSGIILKAK